MTWFNRFRNVIRQEAQRATADISLPRAGIVTHYDLNHHTARVQLQPEGILTGYLPIATPWAGNGWGFYAPPMLGQVVDVHFHQGGKEAGYIVGRFFSNKTKPLPVPSGEFWVVHSSGTALKFTNDGNVLVSAAGDMTLSAMNGMMRLEAKDMKLYATNTISRDVNGMAENWDGNGAETWRDNDTTRPHHNHAPPEAPT